MYNSENSSNTAARFANIENAYQYHPVAGSEKISVDELPISFRLGKSAVNTFFILNPALDLNENERTAGGNSLNENIATYVIEPSTFDVSKNRGYKALRPGESFELGRSNQPAMRRFGLSTSGASRHHLTISKSADGETITIEDLNSLNGTYIGKLNLDTVTTTQAELNNETLEHQPNPEAYAFAAQASSLASERHPNRNEDDFIVGEEHNVFAVFDGIGGHADGRLASGTAKRYIAEKTQSIDTFESLDVAGIYLDNILKGANKHVIEHAAGSGTTAVVAKIHRINGTLYASIAHVGDSRAYLLRDNTLKAVTTDHTPFRRMQGTQEAFAQQERLADTDENALLSTDDIAAFRDRNVIAAYLGDERKIRVDVKHIAVKDGDAIILTSDGVHDNLTNQEMQKIVLSNKNSEYATALTQAASNRSKQDNNVRAKKDDMTAVAIHI